MAQAQEIVAATKTALKRAGVTYARLARALNLSESSVKRMLASGNISLKRLERIAAVLDLEMSDLVEIARERRRDIDQLAEEQERALVSDAKLLLVAFLLLNNWSFEQIITDYAIGELEGLRALVKLDRLKIIDLLPGNKVRMRLSRDFSWRRNGPIQRFFEEQVQSEFFHSRFDGPGELRLVLNGMLSPQSLGVMQQRMQRLATEFGNLVNEDRKLDIAGRAGTTAIFAVRPWSVEVFERFRRPHPEPRVTKDQR